MPSVIEVMDAQRVALDGRVVEVMNRMTNAYGRIWVELKVEIESIAQDIAAGKDRAWLERRIRSLMRQVDDRLRVYGAYADTTLGESVSAAVGTALTDIEQVIAADVGERMPQQVVAIIDAQWNRLNVEAVNNMIAMTSAGSPLRSRMTELLGESVAQAVGDKMNYAVARGWNPLRTVAELRKTFGQGLEWSVSQVRTAQIYSYREATRASMMANSNIVIGWQWAANLTDARTCMSCINKNGSIHPIDEPLKDHYNGRCRMRPLTRVSDITEIPNGEEWFKTQPVERQQALMGSGMYEAWQNNQFAFSDLSKTVNNDIYGDMLQAASLKELVS